MINSIEIKEMARLRGVPTSTIERDYAQNWLLKAMYSGHFPGILKGGTGIRKVYVRDYRFSEDLDFTLMENISKDGLGRLLKEAVIRAKQIVGVDFSEDVILKMNTNGFEGVVYFRLLRRSGHPLRIKLDITRQDMERIILEPETRGIIHQYTDDFSSKVKTYQIEEIIAEKIRALFQRTRPRDLYDVWYMRKILDSDTIVKIFQEKCKGKDINPDPDAITIRRSNFAYSWDNSLRHLVKHLPDFNDIYIEVLDIINNNIMKRM